LNFKKFYEFLSFSENKKLLRMLKITNISNTNNERFLNLCSVANIFISCTVQTSLFLAQFKHLYFLHSSNIFISCTVQTALFLAQFKQPFSRFITKISLVTSTLQLFCELYVITCVHFNFSK